jgi:hypothetical protein
MFQRLSFDPDTTRAAAFDDVCGARAGRLIARKIILLAGGSERDRARLYGETRAYFDFEGSGDECACA